MKSLLVSLILMVSVAALADEPIAGTLPNQVLALEATQGFSTAMDQARAALKKQENQGLNVDHILILGYSVKDSVVAIEVGGINNMWPTQVFKTGEIRAEFRFFPDGINGFMVSGTPIYVEQAPTFYPGK